MNMQNIMAQAQRMQNEILSKQNEIYKKVFTGKSEWYTVTMNGKKQDIKGKITYEGEINTQEDKEILEDMIALAFKDAFSQIEKEIDSKLGSYSKQLSGLM